MKSINSNGISKIFLNQNSSSFLKFGCPNSKDLECPGLYVGSISKTVKADLSLMKKICLNRPISYVSLSANQIGSTHNMFIIRKRVKANHWDNYTFFSDFDVFINPKITSFVKNRYVENWEYCPSFPGLRAKVARYSDIKIHYHDENLSTKEIEINGFKARVFQHELDHLKGLTLLNWRLCHLGLEFVETEENETNNEIKKLVGEYMNEINKMKEQYPEKFAKRRLNDLNTNDSEETNETYFDLEGCRKEMQVFDFEEVYYEKFFNLFARKMAFSEA